MEFIDGPPTWREWNGLRWYYRKGRYWSNTGIPLAQAVWVHHNGPIPEGHDIHHLSGDKADDRIENLAAAPRRAHRQSHASANAAKTPRAAAQAGAAAMWAKRKPIERECEECGQKYESIATRPKYCHANCRARARRRIQREQLGMV